MGFVTTRSLSRPLDGTAAGHVLSWSRVSVSHQEEMFLDEQSAPGNFVGPIPCIPRCVLTSSPSPLLEICFFTCLSFFSSLFLLSLLKTLHGSQLNALRSLTMNSPVSHADPWIHGDACNPKDMGVKNEGYFFGGPYSKADDIGLHLGSSYFWRLLHPSAGGPLALFDTRRVACQLGKLQAGEHLPLVADGLRCASGLQGILGACTEISGATTNSRASLHPSSFGLEPFL